MDGTRYLQHIRADDSWMLRQGPVVGVTGRFGRSSHACVDDKEVVGGGTQRNAPRATGTKRTAQVAAVDRTQWHSARARTQRDTRPLHICVVAGTIAVALAVAAPPGHDSDSTTDRSKSKRS